MSGPEAKVGAEAPSLRTLWVRKWRLLGDAGRILFQSVKNFDADQGFDQAATISYFALLSVLPLSILLFAWGAAVIGSADVAEEGLKLLLRDLAIRLGPDVFAQARDIGSHAGRYGWPFLLLALWTASKVFSKAEGALDRVFRVENRRHFALRKIFAISLVAVLALVLLGFVILSSAVSSFNRFVDSTALASAKSNPLYVALDNVASRYLAPWVLTVITFGFVYKVVPACSVSWRAAGVAAIVAGSLWETIKNAFTWYLGNVAKYARIYGTLETVVVFIIWVNLSAILLLWGAQLAALLNGSRRLGETTGSEVSP